MSSNPRVELYKGLLKFTVTPDTASTFSSIVGTRYRNGHIVANPTQLVIESAIAMLPELEMSPEVESIASQWREWAAWRKSTAVSSIEDSTDLYPFQRAGVEFMKQGHTLLADEMGTGKTVQSLTLIEDLKTRANLVVCTASMALAWEKETIKWAPSMIPILLTGTSQKRQKQMLLMEAILSVLTLRDQDGSTQDYVGSAAKRQCTPVSLDSRNGKLKLNVNTRLGDCTISLAKSTINSWKSKGEAAPFVEKLIQATQTVERDSSISTIAIHVEPSEVCSVLHVIGKLTKISIKTQNTYCGVVGIMNWESMTRHTAHSTLINRPLDEKSKSTKELNRTWNVLIADEIHKAKNPDSNNAKGILNLAKSSQLRIGLTGTPIVQSPDDLWSLLAILMPDEWPAGSRSRYRKLFTIGGPGFFGGWKTERLDPKTEPLLRRVLDARVLRRTKKMVLPQLPDKLPTEYIPVQLHPKQWKAYNQMVDYLMAVFDEGSLTAANMLSATSYLRLLASAMPVVDEEGKVIAMDTPSSKIDTMMDIIKASDGQKVVYADSRKLIELADKRVLKEGYTRGLITGTTSTASRELSVTEFQKGNLDLILGTTGAGAEGITLTKADTIIFLQPPWSNKDFLQSQDRLHRIGQKSKVSTIVLHGVSTVDTNAINAIARKKQQLEEVVKDKEALINFMKGKVA